jgi:hypothetical protein
MNFNNLLNHLYSLSYIQIITLALVFLGVILLLSSIITVFKFTKILSVNEYDKKQWLIITVLIVFFIAGYSIHALDVFKILSLPIDSALMVSLIYFFGAVFVIMAMRSTHSLVKSILGEILSEDKAIALFLARLGAEKEEFKHLRDTFSIPCEHCNSKINYTVADVIRQHATIGDKGVNVQTTFGIRSILLRPTHKCIDGRREIICVHDNDLAYRSIDQSRIILGEKI